MPHGMNTGNNSGYTPLPFNAGQMWNSFMDSSRTGVGTKDAKDIGTGKPPAAPANNGEGNFFTRLMNSSKTGVGTPEARDINNPIRPSQPTGEDTVYAPRIERKPGPFDPGYVKPNTTMEPTDPAARNEYLNPAPDVAFVPDSTLNNGRDNSRKNANGIVQKGTDMGRSFNDLLATTNTSGYQPFSSNQLPTTAGSPDSKVTSKTQAILAGIQAGKETDMSIEGYQPPASTQPSARDGVLGGIRGGARTDRGIQGTSTAADGVFAGIQGGQKTDQGIEGYKKPGSTSRLDAALNDKAGMQSYMSKFSSGDQERAANRAFLDTEGSMEALRAKEAVNGVVFAQQQHYIAGAEADGPAQKITRDEARGISNGKNTASGLLDTYKSRIKDAQKSTPAEAQDPLSAAGSAVQSGFAAGAKTDFNLNNSQGTPKASVGPVVDHDTMMDLDLNDPAVAKEHFRKLDSGAYFK